MKELKTVGEFKVYQKRSGRFAVIGKNKRHVNGEDKIKVLAEGGLVKLPEPKTVESEAVEAAPAAEETQA